MQTQTFNQQLGSFEVISFESSKKLLNPFTDLATEFEESILMSNLFFSCAGSYDDGSFGESYEGSPEYVDPNSNA